MDKIISIVKNSKKPVTPQEIAGRLHARQSEITLIRKMLDRYVREGKLTQKNGRYFVDNEKEELLKNYNALTKYVCRNNQNALATQAICFRKSFFDIYGYLLVKMSCLYPEHDK